MLMAMKKMDYTKIALTYEQQLQQLKNRGLKIANERLLLHLLEVRGYYRLSGYWYPLLKNKEKHVFKENASFETVCGIYDFDTKLRQLVINVIEDIEVATRAKMTHVMSHSQGAFWHTDTALFSDISNHKKTLDKIKFEFKRSDAKFIRTFKEKYTNTIPPSWITFEVVTFGLLSSLYKNMKPGKNKRKIANFFGINNGTFQTWLHSLVYVRNLCAHHSRLWNRELRIRPEMPNKIKYKWIGQTNVSNSNLYIILCIINYLLFTIAPKNNFAQSNN